MINAVVDLSHHNATADFAAARADGILAVVLKATQGTSYKDPTYTERLIAALDADVMAAAYHFGIGGDPLPQVDRFLSVAEGRYLLALDVEANHQGASMTLAEAEAFVTIVHEVTQRWPLVYGGHYLKTLVAAQKPTDTPLGFCPLWLAQYGPVAHLPRAWESWTLWQYTDGAAGREPHRVAGIGRCDRSKFNGDEAGLRRLFTGEST